MQNALEAPKCRRVSQVEEVRRRIEARRVEEILVAE